jgi:hypothetical protein
MSVRNDSVEFDRVFHSEIHGEPKIENIYKRYDRKSEIDLIIKCSDYYDINEPEFEGNEFSWEHKIYLVDRICGILNYSDSMDTVREKVQKLFKREK